MAHELQRAEVSKIDGDGISCNKDAEGKPYNTSSGGADPDFTSSQIKLLTRETGREDTFGSNSHNLAINSDDYFHFLDLNASDSAYLSEPWPDNYAGLYITKPGVEGPWVRLLQLNPGQYDAPLSGKLVRRPLWDIGFDYSALSYSWRQRHRADKDKPAKPVSLALQHKPAKISEHLAQALRRLRSGRGYAYVWVDAVCINQRDDDERASQVPLMFQIFGKATQVYIWLGEPPDMPMNEKRQWICTQERPWWSRLWVVQECIYSTQCPKVLLGPHEFRLNHFVGWLFPPGPLEEPFRSSDLAEVTDSFRDLYKAWLKHKATNSAREPLLRRLLQTKDLECKDFHDRVYALLSLTLERNVAHFVIDYQKNAYDLAIELCTALFKTSAWTYGDLQFAYASIMQVHNHALRGYSDATRSKSNDLKRDFYTPLHPPVSARIGLYKLIRLRELDHICVEPIMDSQLIAPSSSRRRSERDNSNWFHRLLSGWWTAKLPDYGELKYDRAFPLVFVDKYFQGLCYLYSSLPKEFFNCHGIYEWKTLSGVCGFYFSPRQPMNAKVLFSVRENVGLVIDDNNGTYPCYVVSNPTREYPGRRSRVLFDFVSPRRWSYEPPEQMVGFNFSESLSITRVEPMEHGSALHPNYFVGFKINGWTWEDELQWKRHFLSAQNLFRPSEFLTAAQLASREKTKQLLSTPMQLGNRIQGFADGG